MISSITGATPALPATPVSPAPPGSKHASAVPPSSGGADRDTVHLSSSAQAQLSAVQAAVQEATERPAQTAKEARSGDLQAQHLLAREAQAAAQLETYGPSTVRGR